MAGKIITYSQKISGMLASLTAFLCTTIIFLKSTTINMTVLLYALSVILPATLAMGFLGYFIGKIFDSTKKKKSLNKFIK